jgi:hypothetical protein
VLHCTEKRKKIISIFTTGLHNEPQGCGASVASAGGPSPQKENTVAPVGGDYRTGGKMVISNREKDFLLNKC